jgi:hypothetical protein
MKPWQAWNSLWKKFWAWSGWFGVSLAICRLDGFNSFTMMSNT